MSRHTLQPHVPLLSSKRGELTYYLLRTFQLMQPPHPFTLARYCCRFRCTEYTPTLRTDG